MIIFSLNKLNIDEVKVPQEPIAPIPYLEIKDPAYKCEFHLGGGQICSYIRGDLRNLITHCSQEHSLKGWNNNRKRGRYSDNRSILPPNIIRIRAQSFFPSRENSQLFRVIDDSPRESREQSIERTIENREETSTGEALFTIASQKLDLRLRAIEAPDRENIGEVLAENEPNPWLERTGWPNYLSPYTLDQLLSYIAPIDLERDRELGLLVKILKGLIWRAYREAKPNLVGLASLEYINRKESGENSNERPLNIAQEPDTIDRYSSNWAIIIIYIYRTYNIASSDRPPYILTPKQKQSIDRLKLLIETFIRYFFI